MSSPIRTRALAPAITLLLLAGLTGAGAIETTVPPPGIREHTPAIQALTGARIVTAPGEIIENGTIVVRDGAIVAVGAEVRIPADASVTDLAGKTIYPGFIDAYSESDRNRKPDERNTGNDARTSTTGTPKVENGASYWNPRVTPQTRAADTYVPKADVNKTLRSQGITARLVAPANGIIKGVSALVNTGDACGNAAILNDRVALHGQLTRASGFGSRGYPDSPMGAMALFRQAFYDAEWYRDAWTAYRKSKTLTRPEKNDALEALQKITTEDLPVIINSANELYFLRAHQVGNEFGLDVIVAGSGDEYRRLEAIKATGRPVILPLDFPEAPNVKTPEAAKSVSLQTLLHWDIAPENPARLVRAGVPIAFTTEGLKDAGSFLEALRTAVRRGLSPEAALRALTTEPARLFGMSRRLGTLKSGKIANFIVTDGAIFENDTKILETWVDGHKYEVETPPLADVRGTWSLEFTGHPAGGAYILTIGGQPAKLSGTIARDSVEETLIKVGLDDIRLGFSFKGDSLGHAGIVRMSATVSGDELTGSGVAPDGRTLHWQGTRTAPFVEEPDTSTAAKPEAVSALYDVNYPLGAYGITTTPEQPDAVLFQGATVWTCGPDGVLENASVLVRKGRIAAIGHDLEIPANALVIDLTGKHLTPGLIDCHSHIATDGGVNESGQTITAEVRIGDFIDCNQISIYRQLTGGTTASNILHGSANTIGGQNQIIKLRWGALPEEMKFQGAPEGIKFALGENVKQSNWGDDYRTRYPQTRMGAEQIVRDEFEAARDYEARWTAWRKNKRGMPPRRDLELDAIVEILNGRRDIHCHSYRQDEILALMRTCEDYGVRIKTFQHILEGYKVADVMAQHGAGGSSFSDWWAYKFEVYDAIPYNGVLMHNAGVVVSFNSDNSELGARLNLEAAKAIKYGGVLSEEALAFVTANPARQLGIFDRVGSIETGKDADLAIWSGPPMSAFTRCEQTWVDGRLYFDIEDDLARRERDKEMRAAIIQRILSEGESAEGQNTSDGPQWPRHDIFCGHCGYETEGH